MASPPSRPDLGVFMSLALRILTALLGLPLVGIGLLWCVLPELAASLLGASLLEGTGRTTQIGDSAAFFLGSGTMLVLAHCATTPPGSSLGDASWASWPPPGSSRCCCTEASGRSMPWPSRSSRSQRPVRPRW